jgi:hypothetical protein
MEITPKHEKDAHEKDFILIGSGFRATYGYVAFYCR